MKAVCLEYWVAGFIAHNLSSMAESKAARASASSHGASKAASGFFPGAFDEESGKKNVDTEFEIPLRIIQGEPVTHADQTLPEPF